MEPPAKRLRILKSVEVDEDNPIYIRKKREAEVQLKNQFESIFAKYENMSEDMSDEIDMVKGTVVVDRGHLRSLQGKPNALRAADFLEDLLVGDGPGGIVDGHDEDELDELAPPEPPRKKSMQKSDDKVHANNQIALMPPALPPHAPFPIPIQSEVATTPVHTNPIQVPQTPAGLMQLAQLPPTPASLTQLAQLAPTAENQLVQNNFLAAFSQTMIQAVHQAFSIASLMSDHSSIDLPTTPFIPSAGAPATVDKVVPATNPRWYFPPLPEKQVATRAAQSSPIPASNIVRKRRRSLIGNIRKHPTKQKNININPSKTTSNPASVIPMRHESAQAERDDLDTPDAVAFQPDVTARIRLNSSRGNTIYVFSREDDAYIMEQKELKDSSWSEIKDGQPAWKDWPLSAIQNRYLNHLKGRGRKVRKTTKKSEHIIDNATGGNETQDRKDLEPKFSTFTQPSKVNIVPERRRNKTHFFSSDDDRFIIEQRNVHRLSWAEIKDGRPQWQDWPMSVIHNHWYHDLRKRIQDVKDTPMSDIIGNEDVRVEIRSLEQDEEDSQIQEEGTPEKLEVRTVQDLTSQKNQRQLLTPSSLQQSSSGDMQKDIDMATTRSVALRVEYDEKDLQLTIAESQDIGSPPPEETVLQSIETDIVIGKRDDLEPAIYSSPLVEKKIQSPQRSASVFERSEPVFNNLESSPFRFVRRSNPKPKEMPSFQVDSESEADDFDPVHTGSSPAKPSKITKAVKAQHFAYANATPRNTKHAMAPPPPPSTFDDSDSNSDELHSSPALTKTITIKCEPSTPRSSLFSTPNFKTPNSAPQPTTTKSIAKKLSRKEILRVQHSWTKKGRRGSPAPKQSHAPRKRASLLSLQGMRSWDAGSVENSDDELAK